MEDEVMDRINVLVADDHKAILDRVAELLSIECNVVGAVTDGQQALDSALTMNPDVLVLDISMPVMNGLETACHLKKAGVETRVVFLTVHDKLDFVKKARDVGALGYVIKQNMASDLVTAVKEAYAGRSFRSPSLAPL